MSEQCMECLRERGEHETWCSTGAIIKHEDELEKEARKQAFLEAIQEVEMMCIAAFDGRWDIFDFYETLVDALREKADEEDGTP